MENSEPITPEKLFLAWDGFKKGKQWRPDVLRFEASLEDNIFQLHEDLITKRYQHQSYERIHIYDPKFRVIHKAVVRDRVVHHLLFNYLEPLFEPRFIFHSYACRKEKGLHKGVDALYRALRKESKNYTQQAWALKLDVKKFFDSVDHKILLNLLHGRINDIAMRWLVGHIVSSFHSSKGYGKGLPIGNLTSQIFANIYLNQLDYFVKYELKVRYYFRYADDVVIVHRNTAYLQHLIAIIETFLTRELALTLHPQKIVLRKFQQGIDFLGYVSLPHYRMLRTKTKRRMMRRIEQWQPGEFGTVESYLGLLKHCNGYGLSKKIRGRTYYDECWKYGIMPLR